MNDFPIKRATRQGTRPLICAYSPSGYGKTYTSLLLARGFVGPTGKIILIDSEAGRGAQYGEVLPGGYDTIDISEPFSPARYIKAMQAVEQAGAGIGIIDSGSHEWEGLGGVLDMASENEAKTSGLNVWRVPKMEHSKFVLKLMQSPIPWIICLRSKFKTRQVKEGGKKSEIVKDDFTTPIQAEDFIFEMTVHMELQPDHSVRITKPDPGTIDPLKLRDCFPKSGAVTIEHGALLAQWCNAPKGPGTANAKPLSQTDAELKALKKKLWEMTKSKHGGQMKALEQWLIDEAIISDTETLEDFGTIERMTALIAKVEGKLQGTA